MQEYITLTCRYWVKVCMIRKMDLSLGEFHEMSSKWKILGGDRSKLRAQYSNLRKQIFQRLDQAVTHWFSGIGKEYVLDPTRSPLSVEQAKGVVSDKAMLRRIWCPIDVLDDTLWTEVNNAWILLLAS